MHYMMERDSTVIKDRPKVKEFKFIVAVFAITLTRLIYGYDRGSIGGASIGWLREHILTDDQYSELVSLPMFASIIGGLLAGYLQNRLGRKSALLLSALTYGVGLTLCVMFSKPSYTLLFLGRLICNFAFGMGHVTSLVYLLELSPSHLRGKVLVANQMVKPVGNSISGLVNLAVSKLWGSSSWRPMLGSSIVPCILQILFILALPESFKWLYCKGEVEKSREKADMLYKSLTSPQFKDILYINAKKEITNFRNRPTNINAGIVGRMLTVSLALIIIGQLSGFSAIMFYSNQVAQKSGIGNGEDGTGVFLVSEGIFLANSLGVLISLLIIEKLGRRNLLLLSQAGTLLSIGLIIVALFMVDSMAVRNDPWLVNPKCLVDSCSACVAQPYCGFCMFNTTAAAGKSGFCVDGNGTRSVMDRCEISGGTYCSTHCHSTYNSFLVLSMFLFVIYFSLGLAPIPFVVAAEIFPHHLRDMFTSVSISTYYAMTALVILAFGELFPLIGIKYTFTIFGCLTLLGLVFVLVVLPETSGTSPEVMYELFERPWCCGPRQVGVYHVISSRCSDDEEEEEDSCNRGTSEEGFRDN